MEISKQVWGAITGTVGGAIGAAIVSDIYFDWAVEGKSLVSTLAENLPLLALVVLVLVGGFWVYRTQPAFYMRSVSRWQLVGTAGIALLMGWVLGIQIRQGELKPGVILFQSMIGGAAAGTAVGYANARREESVREIQRKRDRFQALFSNVPAEIAEVRLTTSGLQVEQVNSAFEVTFGTTADGELLSETVVHDRETLHRIENRVESGKALEAEVNIETVDAEGHFQLRVAPFEEDRAYLTYTDITELVELQNDLQETVTELERANKAVEQLEISNKRLEDFAYIASHDLQEPLRTVSRYAELIAEDHGEDLEQPAQGYLDTVITGAERMNSMLNGLLDYSRVTTRGKEFSPVDTEAVVDGVVGDLKLMSDEESGAVTYDSLPTVTADRDQLLQVFQNLIKNALEHSGEQSVEISISATEDDDSYTFVVADDGPGIDPHLRDDVFKMFESDSNYQTQGKAKGIGLAVVDRIIERHGGEIWVESETGKGSRFCFTIPKVEE